MTEYLIIRTDRDTWVTAQLTECAMAEALHEGGLKISEVMTALDGMDRGEARELAPGVFIWRLHESDEK